MQIPPLIRRDVQSPLKDEDLADIAASPDGHHVVQFNTPLADADYERLAEFLKQHPNVTLRPYAGYSRLPDLSFLRYFPFIQRLSLSGTYLRDLSSLLQLSGELTHLQIADFSKTAKERFSFRELARFPKLRSLCITGKFRHPEAVSSLMSLRYLGLRGAAIKDLRHLIPLKALRHLDLSGGLFDFPVIGQLTQLHSLQFGRLSKLTNLDFLPALTSLRFLDIHWQKQVTTIPDLSALKSLRVVYFDRFLGLCNVDGLFLAPALKHVLLADCPKISPACKAAIQSHPTLKSFHCHDLRLTIDESAARHVAFRTEWDRYRVH